jgi:hypothetical protein
MRARAERAASWLNPRPRARPSRAARPPPTAPVLPFPRPLKVRAAVAGAAVDWKKTAEELDAKSPLEIMDHALKTFGDEIAIAFSGAEDVALIEYAHLTGRPYRVFRCGRARAARPPCTRHAAAARARHAAAMRHALSWALAHAAAAAGARPCPPAAPSCCSSTPPPTFSLDTGRLNPETYKLFDDVEKHYKIHIE